MINLVDVLADDLSLLLEHRNSVETRRWLENHREISKADQQRWFSSGAASGFRIIYHQGVKIGLARISCANDSSFCSVGLDIFVDFRGRGLGKAAFSSVINEGTKYRKDLELWVFWENIPARKIYEHYGFVVDGATPVKVFAREINGELRFLHYIRMARCHSES